MTVKDLIIMLQSKDFRSTIEAEDFYGNSYPIEGVTVSLNGDTLITLGKKK